MLRIFGPSFSLVSFAIGLGCVFSGSGYNIPFLVSSLAGRWGAQVPVLALVVYALPLAGISLGLPGVWASFLLSDTVETFVIIWFYRRGTWKTVRV